MSRRGYKILNYLKDPNSRFLISNFRLFWAEAMGKRFMIKDIEFQIRSHNEFGITICLRLSLIPIVKVVYHYLHFFQDQTSLKSCC